MLPLKFATASTWLSSLDDTWEKFFSDDCDGLSSQSSPKKCCLRSLLFIKMLELPCCGLVILLLQLLQQSCWQAPCGEVGRVGQAARAGSLQKDRAGQDYDATLFLERQHAEPLNMQPLFFLQQPRRSARRSPGSASGFGRVAQVRAEVRVTHKQFSQRILRISSSSVPSECLASQFPASVAGRSSQRPRVSCACSASRFDSIELPSLPEQKCDLDGTRHCSSGGLHCRLQCK